MAKEAKGDPKDRFVCYNHVLPALGRGRFQTKNKGGGWVALDDPSAPNVTLVGE